MRGGAGTGRSEGRTGEGLERVVLGMRAERQVNLLQRWQPRAVRQRDHPGACMEPQPLEAGQRGDGLQGRAGRLLAVQQLESTEGREPLKEALDAIH